jgi:hypothetical protein
MVSRSDVQVFFDLSPRLIVVEEPSTVISLQDLHDTLRDIEDEPDSLQYPTLITSAGKEPLGAGVSVGITSTLQNAQIMFERRTIRLQTGTITTASTPGRAVLVIDSAAQFQTNGVTRGDLVLNRVDLSRAEVLTVDSETQLTVLSPSGGTEDDYDIGEAYTVFQIVRCDIEGGNLVAVDENQATIDPFFPSFGTSVVRTSSSSATVQELASLQFATFNGGVTVDTTSSYSGTIFPTGTLAQPVNNFADALSIATTRGFSQLFVIGDATLTGALDFAGVTLIGESQTKTTITVDPSVNVLEAEFTDCTLTGTLDGTATLVDCTIKTLTFLNGFIDHCLLEGPITVVGPQDVHLLACRASSTPPTIDCGGDGPTIVVRNYSGRLTLSNKTGSADVIVDMVSGEITLDSTVSAGTITVRGIGDVIDNSTGTAIVDADLVASPTRTISALRAELIDTVSIEDILQVVLAMARGDIEFVGGQYKVKAQDGTTTLFTFSEAAGGRTVSVP